MFRNMFVLIFLFVSGIRLVLGRTCCKTEYDTYKWCSDNCCTSSLGSYGHCCTASISFSSYQADDSECNDYFESHVYVAVLIGLGSFASFIGCIVCCVRCVKSCTNNNRRTGALVTNNGQPGVGMFMVNNSMAQQGQTQQPFPQPNQPSYPPQGYGQHRYNQAFQPTTSTGHQNPPPYSDSGVEKAGGSPVN